MATYNRANFIVESLESIRNQTFKNWECLIIDDGGTDNTLEVITPLLQVDKRFKFIKRSNKYLKGLPGCRNYGLDLAQTEYIIFFDDDDIIHPQNLEICHSILSKNNDKNFCHYIKKPFVNSFEKSEINKIDKYEVLPTPKNILEKMILGEYPIASCTVLWRKECFYNTRFTETLMYAEEWECFQRVLSDKSKVNGVKVNEVLYFNRKHENSNTGEFWNKDSLRVQSKKEAIKLIAKNLIEKKLLSETILKHLAGSAISFRDKLLLNDILTLSETPTKNKLYLILKYYMFPLWKEYKNILKTTNLL